MSIEEAIMGGIVFKGKKDKPQEDEKVKTKAKKATYIRGQHGSGAAKMKADIRKKRANLHKKLESYLYYFCLLLYRNSYFRNMLFIFVDNDKKAGQDNHPAPLFYHMNYFCGSISIQ